MINCIKLITTAEMIKAIHVFQLPKPPSREILSLFLASLENCFYLIIFKKFNNLVRNHVKLFFCHAIKLLNGQ